MKKGFTYLKASLILAFFIAVNSYGSAPYVTNNIYLDNDSPQFYTVTAIQNTKEFKFYLFNSKSDTNGWDATGWTVDYMFSNKSDPSEAIPMATISCTVSGNEITMSPATNDFITVFNNGYAVLRIAKTGEQVSYARGTHTTLPAPEITSTEPFQGSVIIDWSMFTYTNNETHGTVIPDGTTITSTNDSNGRMVISAHLLLTNGQTVVESGTFTGGVVSNTTTTGPDLEFSLTTNDINLAESDPVWTNDYSNGLNLSSMTNPPQEWLAAGVTNPLFLGSATNTGRMYFGNDTNSAYFRIITNQVYVGNVETGNYEDVTLGATALSTSGVVTGRYDTATRTMIIGSDMTGYLTTETDPIFTNWLSTNAVLTAETDPVFTNWLSDNVYMVESNNLSNDIYILNTNSLSAERLVNGTFTGDSDGWLMTNAFYSANEIFFPFGITSSLTYTNDADFHAGEVYLLSIDLGTSDSGETVSIRLGGDEVITSDNETDTYTYLFKTTNFNTLAVYITTTLDSVTVDTISVKQVNGADLYVGGKLWGDGTLLDITEYDTLALAGIASITGTLYTAVQPTDVAYTNTLALSSSAVQPTDTAYTNTAMQSATAYGWGDHSTNSYVVTETDTIWTNDYANGLNLSGMTNAPTAWTAFVPTADDTLNMGGYSSTNILFIQLKPTSAAPSPAVEGTLYYDSDDNKLKCYNGSVWTNCY
jgi:hypothetical protein